MVKNETAEQRLINYVEKGLHLGKINSKKFKRQIYDEGIKIFGTKFVEFKKQFAIKIKKHRGEFYEKLQTDF